MLLVTVSQHLFSYLVMRKWGGGEECNYYLLWIRWFLIGPISSRFDDFDGVFQYCEWVEGMGEKEVKKLVRNIIFLIFYLSLSFKGRTNLKRVHFLN